MFSPVRPAILLVDDDKTLLSVLSRRVGRAGYEQMIGDDIRLSRLMYDMIDTHPELEGVSQGLSITTFRYVPNELRDRTGAAEVSKYLNDLNSALVTHLQSSDELFISNAVVDGKYVLRACITNWRTEEQNVQAVPEIAAKVGAQLHGHMRKQMLVTK